MSTQVDNRVVEMTFDNERFERNIKKSMESIKQLDKDLKLVENASYLTNLDKSIKNFSLDTISNSVESLSDRFSTMGIIGMNVISRLTNGALDFAKKVKTSFIDPIKTGGLNRALNIEQAEFQLKGLGMNVESVMEDVNYAVQDTAYGLDAAAKIAAQFGASGIKSGEQMQAALRGVSGVAAMTNSSYEDIGRIFATVAGNGRLMANELNQIGARGLNAAAALGKYLGISEAEVRKMTSQGKIDFQTFAMAMDSAFGEHAKDANKTFTGALSNMKAAMNRIGAEFAAPYIRNMRDVINAVTPWLNNLKKALSPVAKDAENIMIGMNKRIVTSLGDENWVDAQINAVEAFRNSLRALLTIFDPIARAWKEVFPNSIASNVKTFTERIKDFTATLGLNSKSMANLRDTFKGVFSILKLVGDIFGTILKTIFPFTEGVGGLVNIVLTLTGTLGRLVTAGINVFEEFGGVSRIFKEIKNVAVGFFSVVTYGVITLYDFASKSKVVQGVLKGIEVIIASVIIDFALLVQQIQKLWNSDPTVFFNKLKTTFVSFIEQIKNLRAVQAIMSVFSKFLEKIGINVKAAKENFINFIAAIKTMGSQAKEAFRTDGIVGFFTSIFESIKEIIGKIKELSKNGGIFGAITNSGDSVEGAGSKLKRFVEIVKEFVSGLTPGKIAAFAFSTAIVTLAFSLSNAVNKMSGSLTGVTSSVKGFFNTLTKTIKDLKKPKNVIIQFAEAVAIMSASLIALTMVDSTKLMNAAKAIGVLVAELALVGVLFNILGHSDKQTKNFEVAAKAMENLAISVGILTLALIGMNYVDMDGIGKKFLVLLGVMASMATVATLMAKFSPQLTKGSLFMLAFSFATSNVIKALASLESINLEEMGDRIAGLFVVMTGLAILAKGVGSVRLTSVVGLYLLIKVLNYALPSIKELLGSINIGSIQKKIEDCMFMIASLSALALVISFAFDKVGSGMKKFGVGLLALSGAILLLSAIPKILKKADLNQAQFDNAMNFIIGIMDMFALIIIATRLASSETNPKKLGIMALEIAASVLLLSLAVKGLGKMDDSDLFKATAAIDSMLILFAGIIACTHFAKGVNTKVLLGAIVGIVVLMGELVVLSLLKWDEILPAATAMALVLISFSESLRIISQSKIDVDKLMGMVAMAIVAGEFAVALNFLADYNWKQLLAASTAMGIMMLSFAATMNLLNGKKFKIENIKGMVAMAIIAGGFAVALNALAKHPWEKLLSSTVAMSVTMLAFAEVIKVVSGRRGLGEGKWDKILQVVGVALAMIPMAYALSKLAENDWDSILAASAGMSLALMAMAGVLGILSKIGGKDAVLASVGIIATAGAMVILGYALKEFSTIDWESIKGAYPVLLGLAGVLGIFGAFVVGTEGLFAVGMIAVAAAFAILGAALLGAGAGILMAGTGLNILIPALQQLVGLDLQTIADGIMQLAPGLALLGIAGVPMLIGAAGIAAGALALMLLTPAVLPLQTVDFTFIGEGLLILAGGAVAMGLAGVILAVGAPGIIAAGMGLIGFAAGILMLSGVDLTVIGTGLMSVAEGSLLLGAAGVLMIAGAPGMIAVAGGILVLSASITVFTSVFTRSMPLIQNAFIQTMNTMSTSTSQAGLDAVKGLITPIMANLPNIVQVGVNMAKALLSGISIGGGWHSPWIGTEKAGLDADAGLIQGSEAGAPAIESSWKKIVSECIIKVIQKGVEKVKEILSKIGIEIDVFASEAGANLSELGSGMDLVKNAASELGWEFEDLTDWTEKFAGPLDDILDTENLLSDVTEELDGNMEGLGSSLNSAGGSASKAKDAMASLTDTISNQLDIFSKFDMKTEMTGEEMLKNMRSQIQGVTQWANNLQTLAERGIDQGLLQKLTDLGPQGYEKVAAFVQMTDAQLSEAGDLFAQSLQLPQSAAQQILGSFANAGKMTAQGFANGMDVHAGDENAAAMGENALGSLNESLGINSPSRETFLTGMNVCFGLANGIHNNTISVITQIAILSMRVISEFNTKLSPSKFIEIGRGIDLGLANGIANNGYLVSDAITKVVNEAIEKAKKALDSHSPSRVFMELGKNTDEGFALGVINNKGLINHAVDDMTDSMISRFNTITNAISTIFNRDLDLNPVITPTLDLSNLINGVNLIDDMFETQRLGVRGYATSGVTGSTGGNTYQFIQNNTSPKALSREDIYRQTNNQISRFKRKVERYS